MNNCRDEDQDPLRLEELIESYSFEDARTGYTCLSYESQELMNNALNGFLRSRGKLHSMKEIMKRDYKIKCKRQ